MQTKNVSLKAAECLISAYCAAGGSSFEAVPGCLGLGVVVLTDFGLHGLRAFVIEERALNEWSSGHVLKIYPDGVLPKKYQAMILD